MNELDALENWVTPLLAKLSLAERNKLSRTIAQQLRKSQVKRIASQQNPSGTPFAPRKPQQQRPGEKKPKAMFRKIRQAKSLRTARTNIGAEVGFIGRIAQIARTHQYGLRDRVSPDGPVVKYPQRELLGFTTADRALVKNLLIDHLT